MTIFVPLGSKSWFGGKVINYSIVREALVEAGFADVRKAGREHAVSAACYLARRCGSASAGTLGAGEPLRADAVALVDAEGAAALEEIARPVSNPLVCLGSAVAERAALAAPAADILVVPDGMEAPRALDVLWGILHEYESWVRDMLLSALGSDSIRQFLAIAGAKLANPVAVLDGDFKILARSEIGESLPVGTIWDRMMGESFDMAAYYGARERALITRAFETDVHREIVFRPDRDPNHRYYSALLQVNGKPAGCIGIVDVFAPISDAQVAIARVVRDMLERYLQRNQRSLLLEDASRGFWFGLITGKPIDLHRIEGKFADVGWRLDDTFIAVSFVTAGEGASAVGMVSAMHQVGVEFPFAKIAVDGHVLTAFMPHADFERATSQSAEPFSRYSGLRVGTSFPFSGMEFREAAYRQSVFAVEYARAHDLDYTDYPEVQAEHLSETVERAAFDQGIPIQTFCNPRLVQLAASPRQSDRALVACLSAYLLNGRNIAETARMLFLHRNTVVYRVKKLSQVLGLDFAQLTESELFSLVVSCRLVAHST